MTLTDAQLYSIIGTLVAVIAGGSKLIYNSKETRIKQLETDQGEIIIRVEALETSNAVLRVHKEQIERCPEKACPWKKPIAMLAITLLTSCVNVRPAPINLLPPSRQDTPADNGPEPLLNDDSLNRWLRGQLFYQNQNPMPTL